MKSINSKFNHTGAKNVTVKEPDKCPVCNHSIDPLIEFAFCNEKKWTSQECLQVVFRCARENCKNLFIAYYMSENSQCSSFK